MRESRLYISFLKNNWMWLLVPAFLGMTAGVFYQGLQPSSFRASQLLEMKYDQLNIPDRIALADHAITLIRSESVQQMLGIDRRSKVIAVKNGPLLIKLQLVLPDNIQTERTSSASGYTLDQLGKATKYLTGRFFLYEVSSGRVVEERPDLVIGAALGLIGGLGAGLLLALIKIYLRSY